MFVHLLQSAQQLVSQSDMHVTALHALSRTQRLRLAPKRTCVIAMDKGEPYLCNSVVGSANEGAQSHWNGTEIEVSICPVAHLGAVGAGIADFLAC